MRGKITIDKDTCKGCEYCVLFCPKRCISLSKDLNVRGVHYALFSKPGACNGCAICARVCPDVCIEVTQKIGGPLYHKVETTITRFIDTGLDKLKGVGTEEEEKRKDSQA